MLDLVPHAVHCSLHLAGALVGHVANDVEIAENAANGLSK